MMRFQAARIAMFLLLAAGCAKERPDAARARAAVFPNAPVILISIDTLRSDHLPAYGYQGVQTPAIDSFRRDSILFERAWAHVPLTLPSHVTLLTGLLPPEHGVRDNLGFALDPDRHPTLPRHLRGRGYSTGAAVSAYVLRSGTGVGGLFDHYDDSLPGAAGQQIGAQQRAGTETVESGLQWIEQQRGRPFFFLLHLFEPHSPYEGSYDEEIARVDGIVGTFLSALKQSGIYERALIVLTSDHGEGLRDHGEAEHGIFVYREALQVPLIVKLPQQQRANETRREVAQLIDLFPTIARLVGIEPPPGLPGRSLLHRGRSGEQPVVYAETMYPRLHLGWSDLRSLIDDNLHFIEAPSAELYDLKTDPRETRNVLRSHRREYARLRERMNGYSRGTMAPAPVDPEEMKKLAALGYLSSPAAAGDGPLPDPKSSLHQLETYKRASDLARAGERARAIAELESLVKANPRFSEAHTLLAHTLAAAGRTADAIAAYRRNLQLNPQLAPGLGLSLSALYLEQNQFDEAAAHARLGERTNPARANLLLGRVELARNNPRLALQYATTAAQSDAERVEARVLIAQIHVRNREVPRALEMLAEAEKEAGARGVRTVPLLEFVRGDALARSGDLAAAEAAFRKAIGQFPGDREAYASLAAVYLMQGKRAEAREAMEQLTGERPSRETFLFAAQTFRSLGDAALARSFESRAARARASR
jgi:tetratricopeptide (TPR) repeat protein